MATAFNDAEKTSPNQVYVTGVSGKTTRLLIECLSKTFPVKGVSRNSFEGNVISWTTLYSDLTAECDRPQFEPNAHRPGHIAVIHAAGISRSSIFLRRKKIYDANVKLTIELAKKSSQH